MKLPIVAAAVLLSGCAASRTTIESSWADAEYSGPPLDRIDVVALFDTRAETLTLDEAQIRERLAPTDVDGILIFRLIAIDERREYQVPTPPSAPSAIAGGNAYSRYYRSSTGDPTVSGPATGSQGYWIEQDFLVAETALFDNRGDRLLWTAKSETLDDARLRRTSESIVCAVARRLIAMDLIARMTAASGSARTLDKDEGSREPRSRGRNRA